MDYSLCQFGYAAFIDARELISNTPTPRNFIQAQEFMNEGKLVTDDIIIGVVKERLAKDDCLEKVR